MYSAISATSADLGTLPNFPPRSHSPRYPGAAATMPRARFSNRGWWPVVMWMVALFLAPTGLAWGDDIQVTTTDAVSSDECTLAEAIATAKAGVDVGACQWSGDRKVKLEAETYDVTDDVLPFVIPSGVSITISGVGGSTDAKIMRDAADADAKDRFFNVFGTLDLSNLTLTGGKQSLGGAIRVFGTGDLILRICRLVDNSATSVGGAIYSVGTFDVTSSIFDGNSAGYYGGAMFVSSSTSTIGSTSTIDMSAFVDNFAGSSGGAITAYSGALGVSNSTFSANEAWRAGAIDQRSNAYALVEMCTFKGNSSALRGSGGNLDLEKSALAGTDLCRGTINSLGNNAAEDSSCALGEASDQQNVPLNLSSLVYDHGNWTPVHVPLCTDNLVTTEIVECESPLMEQYICETGNNVRDQRDQFNRAPTESGVTNTGSKCDIGAYETVYTKFKTNGATGIELRLNGYQVITGPKSKKILDNGGGTIHQISFPQAPDPEANDCRVEWVEPGLYVLNIRDVIFIKDDDPLDYPCSRDHCFEDPAGCAAQCEGPDPTDWVADDSGESTAADHLYGFDVPCDLVANTTPENMLPTAVIEYYHDEDEVSLQEGDLSVLIHWDPINPFDQ